MECGRPICNEFSMLPYSMVRVSSEMYLMMFTIWIYTFLNIYLIEPCSSKAFFSHGYLVKNLFVSHCEHRSCAANKTYIHIYWLWQSPSRVGHTILLIETCSPVLRSNRIFNLTHVYAWLKIRKRFSHSLAPTYSIVRVVYTTFLMFLSMRVLCERILIVGN